MQNEKYIRSKSPKFYPLNPEKPQPTSVTLNKDVYDYPRTGVPLDDLVGRGGCSTPIWNIFQNRESKNVSFIDRAGKLGAIVSLWSRLFPFSSPAKWSTIADIVEQTL